MMKLTTSEIRIPFGMVLHSLRLNSHGLYLELQSKIRPLISAIFVALLISLLPKLRFYAGQNNKSALTFLPLLFIMFLYPIKTSKNLTYLDKFIINFNLHMILIALLSEYNFANKLVFILSYFLRMKSISATT